MAYHLSVEAVPAMWCEADECGAADTVGVGKKVPEEAMSPSCLGLV
jgi:hypothetical protein